MPTVPGELRCRHITSVYFGMGWRELFWEKCPAVVPCDTADEESGSSLKLGSCADQPFVSLETRNLILENAFFQMNPCIKYCFPQIKPWPILDLPVHYTLFIPPPWVWLDLLSTFVLTPFSIFTEKDPDFVSDDVE